MAQKPIPPEIPADFTDEQRQEFLERHGQAYNLAHKSAACYLVASSDRLLSGTYPTPSFETYMNKLLEECGNPADPIERMLVEQLALAHHNLGRLYVRAAKAQDPQHAAVFDAAAARLLGEFRRTALAFKDYRLPPTTKQQLVIRQQNVAGTQQIAYLEQDSSEVDGKNDLDSELNSTRELGYEEPIIFESGRKEGRDWQAELVEARAVDA